MVLFKKEETSLKMLQAGKKICATIEGASSKQENCETAFPPRNHLLVEILKHM